MGGVSHMLWVCLEFPLEIGRIKIIDERLGTCSFPKPQATTSLPFLSDLKLGKDASSVLPRIVQEHTSEPEAKSFISGVSLSCRGFSRGCLGVCEVSGVLLGILLELELHPPWKFHSSTL